MVVWPDSILSSVKTHENTLGICKKKLELEFLSRRKAQCTKILRWKHIIQNLRPGRRFTFRQDNDPTSTQQEWLLDNCKCPSVAQPGIEPNQIFLEKPENVCLPPSNLTELERWREEWQIIARARFFKRFNPDKIDPDLVILFLRSVIT